MITETEEYIKTADANRLMRQELIQIAKGPNRTMEEYARECHTSPATLSRIATGKAKSVSEELIRKLYEHQDPNAKIPLESWLMANGMQRKGEESQTHQKKDLVSIWRERDKGIKELLGNELLKRNITIQMLDERWSGRKGPEALLSGSFLDMKIHLAEKNLYWKFYFFSKRVEDDPDRQWKRSCYHQFRAIYSSPFLFDAWHPEKTSCEKCTFVFADESFKNLFIECIQDARVNGEFSIVLVDMDGEHIVGEYDLRGNEIADSMLTGSHGEENEGGVQNPDDIFSWDDVF